MAGLYWDPTTAQIWDKATGLPVARPLTAEEVEDLKAYLDGWLRNQRDQFEDAIYLANHSFDKDDQEKYEEQMAAFLRQRTY